MTRELPILFKGDMVRAIIDGRKTQTRRISHRFRAGDLLYVRETWHSCPHCESMIAYRAGGYCWPGTDDCSDTDDRPLRPRCAAHGWRPSIFMPKWASRIWLQVESVRTEPLQDISGDDAVAEGIEVCSVDGFRLYRHPGDSKPRYVNPVEAFADLWQDINAKPGRCWNDNPLVQVVRFRRVDP